MSSFTEIIRIVLRLYAQVYRGIVVRAAVSYSVLNGRAKRKGKEKKYTYTRIPYTHERGDVFENDLRAFPTCSGRASDYHRRSVSVSRPIIILHYNNMISRLGRGAHFFFFFLKTRNEFPFGIRPLFPQPCNQPPSRRRSQRTTRGNIAAICTSYYIVRIPLLKPSLKQYGKTSEQRCFLLERKTILVLLRNSFKSNYISVFNCFNLTQ